MIIAFVLDLIATPRLLLFSVVAILLPQLFDSKISIVFLNVGVCLFKPLEVSLPSQH